MLTVITMILIIVHLFEERTPVEAGVQEYKIVDIDADNRDPQMCTFYASDIYDYLHNTEVLPTLHVFHIFIGIRCFSYAMQYKQFICKI